MSPQEKAHWNHLNNIRLAKAREEVEARMAAEEAQMDTDDLTTDDVLRYAVTVPTTFSGAALLARDYVTALTVLSEVLDDLRALRQATFWMEGEYQHSDSEPHEGAQVLAEKVSRFLQTVE